MQRDVRLLFAVVYTDLIDRNSQKKYSCKLAAGATRGGTAVSALAIPAESSCNITGRGAAIAAGIYSSLSSVYFSRPATTARDIFA